jgi:hypothetical protein
MTTPNAKISNKERFMMDLDGRSKKDRNLLCLVRTAHYPLCMRDKQRMGRLPWAFPTKR